MNKTKRIVCVGVNILALLFLVTSVLLLFTTYGSALKGVIQDQTYVESTEVKEEIISNIQDIIDNILVVEFIWESREQNQYSNDVIMEFVRNDGKVTELTIEEMIDIGKGKKNIQLLYDYQLVDDNFECYINYINWIHGPIYVKKEVSLLSVMQLLGKMYRTYVNSEQALDGLSIKPSNLMYYIEYKDSLYTNSSFQWQRVQQVVEQEQGREKISLENIFHENVQYCYVFENTYLVELEMNGVYNAVRDYLVRPGFSKLDFIEDFLKKEGLLDDFGTIRSYVYGQLDWELTEFWRKAAIGIAFDTNLRVEDSFVTFNQQYTICKKWAMMLSIVAFINSIVWIVTSGILLWGNRKKVIQIKRTSNVWENLSWIDRKPPELIWGGAFLCAMLSFLVMLIPIRYVWKNHYSLIDVGNIFGYYKIDGFWVFFLCVFLLVFWYIMLLRLIQRFQIRRELGIQLKEESYIVGILKFLYEVYQHRSVTAQNIVELSMFCIANILNVVFVLSRGGLYQILFWMNFAIINGILFKVLLNRAIWQERIAETIEKMTKGDVSAKVDVTDMQGKTLQLAEEINYLGTGLEKAIEKAIVNERMKTELLTNVSHDIKTPLTSIVNYVDLLKGIHIEDERAKRYLHILEEKSIRLKQLTEDMVEVAKASSGNLSLEMVKLDLTEFLQQAVGEMEYKFPERNLELVVSLPEQSYFIEADGNRLWRVVENLMNNAYKYAMPGTRVFMECICEGREVLIRIKNVSEYPLNKRGNELTERFVRGDTSRSTEGSGLGLSIAKGFVEKMGGDLEIQVDGDFFKVIVKFSVV